MARQFQGKNIHALPRSGTVRRDGRGFPIALIVVGVAGVVAMYSGAAPSVWRQVVGAVAPVQAPRIAETIAARDFAECTGAGMRTCVVDGDTIRLNGDRIRISDIDTPEVFSPQCPQELARGEAATRRLVQLLSAGSFEMLRFERDVDVYGRKLRVLVRDGQSLGQILVSEGLARTWDGARHPWC